MKRIILILMLVFINIIHTQTIQLPKNIQSPNAASLGVYADLPINYYSGRVDVSVPIFSINENGIPLNIGLNYDTGGVRVNSTPSWIGQNWNMNAGGIIMRSEKGKSTDELIYNPNEYPYAQKGYYYNTSTLNSTDWSETSKLTDIVTGAFIKNDFEPDIFSFNFMGISGKFFLGSDGKWKVQSSVNLKVEINMADNLAILGRNTIYPWNTDPGNTPKCFGKITLIDDNGNKYIFGGTQNAIEYCQHNFFDYKQGVIANSWYLVTVKDRLDNIIYSFEYERGGFQPHFYLSYNSKNIEKDSEGSFWNPGSGCFYTLTSSLGVDGTLTIPSYLKKITSRNGYTIDFARSISPYKSFVSQPDLMILDYALTQFENSFSTFDFALDNFRLLTNHFYLFWHDINENTVPITTSFWHDFIFGQLTNKNVKLDNISIKINNNILKTVTFSRNSNISERLNLLGVTINDGGTKPSYYKFQYNNFGLLPSYLSYALDHWGYYKGTNSIIPGSYNFSDSDYYNSREPNSSYLNIGSMTRIVYPTKGYSDFEYEPHSYSQYVDQDLNLAYENKIAGGLRIRKIKTNDGISETTKEIKYTNDLNSTVSSGILALRNRYKCDNWKILGTEGSLYQESVFSISNIFPGSNFSGSHIGYSKVYEINNTNGGHTLYEYTNYSDYPDVPFTNTISQSHSIFDTHNDFDFKRGLIKQISYFDNQNTINPIKKTENFYNNVGVVSTARGLNYDQFAPCYFSGEGVLLGNAYEIQYSDFKLNYSIETDVLGGKSVTKTTTQGNTTYPTGNTFYGNTFLNSESITSSSGETVSLTYKYPFDYVGSSDSQMIVSHFFPVIETIHTLSSQIISKTKNIYQLTPITSVSYPMLKSAQKAKGNASYETDIVIDEYDGNGNILQYHKNDGTTAPFYKSFIYANNLLMFKIEGAKFSDYTTGTNFTTFNSNLDRNVTSYTYNIFRGLETITFPNGIFEKYIYDSDHRLERILDMNNTIVKKFEYNIK